MNLYILFVCNNKYTLFKREPENHTRYSICNQCGKVRKCPWVSHKQPPHFVTSGMFKISLQCEWFSINQTNNLVMIVVYDMKNNKNYCRILKHVLKPRLSCNLVTCLTTQSFAFSTLLLLTHSFTLDLSQAYLKSYNNSSHTRY